MNAFALKAQFNYEIFLHKTYAERAKDLRDYIAAMMVIADSVKAFERLDSLRQFGKLHNDTELELEADLLTAYFFKNYREGQHQLVADHFLRFIENAKEKNNLVYQARGLDMLADYYWNIVGNYELAFEQHHILGELLERISFEALPDKLAHLYHIGEAYYFFADYQKATGYFIRLLKAPVTPLDAVGHNSTRNILGLCYQAIGNLDSSDYYFNQVLLPQNLNGNKVWEGIAKGNLGYNCYLRGEYEKAIPLFEADIKMALETEDWGLASGSLMPQADIYFQRNELAKGSSLLMKARECVQRSGQYKRYQQLYPLMSKMYALKGQSKLAVLYLDSAMIAKDSMTRRFSALQLLRVRQKIALQEHRAEVEKMAAEKQIKILERNILVAFAVILMLLSLYVYNNKLKKHRQQRLLLDIQLKSREKELAAAGEQLNSFAKRISEKKALIETLEKQFGENSTNEALGQLRSATILTDEEWEKFRLLFEQVYTGYLGRLREKLPGLTPAETRFMALAKLGLSNKEMAAVLGVSTQNMRTIWYRLRKKLDLPEDADIETLVNRI